MKSSFLIAVKYRSRIRLAIAGREAGDPQQAGLTILRALRSEFNSELFINKIHFFKAKTAVLANGDDLIQAGARPVSFDRFKADTLSLSEIDKNPLNFIHIIQNTTDSQNYTCMLDYAADARNLQWGYLLNLDENTFEVYKGFNKIPLKENDAFHLCNAAARHFNRIAKDGEHFAPLIKFKSYPLDQLPEDHKLSGVHKSAFFSVYYNDRVIATTDQRYFGSPSLLGSILVHHFDHNYQLLPLLYEKVELIKESNNPFYGNAVVLLESLLEAEEEVYLQKHAVDSSYHDYGYVLNLDTETLDFYRNFMTLDPKDRLNGSKLLYGNIRVASFDLYDLPKAEVLGKLTDSPTYSLLKKYGPSLR